MIKAIALLGTLASLIAVPPQTMPKKIETPPKKPNETTVIVGFMHTADPNYTVEGNDLTVHDKLHNNDARNNSSTTRNIQSQDNRNIQSQDNTTKTPNSTPNYSNDINDQTRQNDFARQNDINDQTDIQRDTRYRRPYRRPRDRRSYQDRQGSDSQNDMQNNNNSGLRTLDIQDDPTQSLNPDEHYSLLKSKLDERFSYMFELKASLERQQSETAAKWEEYYLMRQSYERQLKRIIADWVMNVTYA